MGILLNADISAWLDRYPKLLKTAEAIFEPFRTFRTVHARDVMWGRCRHFSRDEGVKRV